MPICELRCGKYQEQLADLDNVDSFITDPPYSNRTHTGSIESSTGGVGDYISYGCFTEKDCEELCKFMVPRVNNWIVLFGDHITARWYEHYLTKFGLYVFAPVFYVKINPMPRIQGDGPTSSVEWITRASTEQNLIEMAQDLLAENDPRLEFQEDEAVITVARHKAKVRTTGSRPGHYLAKVQQKDTFCAGQKDLNTCIEIIKDYSDPGDLVVDPFAGSGVISRGCQITGRNAIASEVRPHIHYLAQQRLREPIQLQMD